MVLKEGEVAFDELHLNLTLNKMSAPPGAKSQHLRNETAATSSMMPIGKLWLG
jgi:hypothetical protein